MKIKLLVCCSYMLLINGMKCDASPPVQNMNKILLPKVKKELQIEKENLNSLNNWVTYTKIIGADTVHIKFPHDPIVDIQEDLEIIFSIDDNVNYSMAYLQDVYIKDDANAFFDLIQKSLRTEGFKISKSKKSHFQDFPSLDIYAKNKNEASYIKFRILITEQNIYMLETNYSIKGQENHDHFVQSLIIE